jgi:hypothetical protein
MMCDLVQFGRLGPALRMYRLHLQARSTEMSHLRGLWRGILYAVECDVMFNVRYLSLNAIMV